VSDIPHLPGIITAEEVRLSGEHLAALQVRSGMIPWFPGGHCDPWNHVESTMALDVAGLHDEAFRGYRWLVDSQRADGSWHNYYRADGSIEDAKLDSNVCAYVATGVWHHWLATGRLAAVVELWPTVERALEFVLSLRRHDATILWARHVDDAPWDYALLTGSSSIQHALRCGVQLATLLGLDRSEWTAAANRICSVINERPEVFEPKERWAMDWYYPVLTGAMVDQAAKARLGDGYSTFTMEGKGIRCVSDEPWVTASETAEASLAYSAIGDIDTASDLLLWTRSHRRDDGSYDTGIVYPGMQRFPGGEHTSYTAAAVILAADAISATSPASNVFVPHR
jgi:hypothetical protein